MEIDGRLEGLQPYEIHGTLYYRAYYSHLDAPDDIRFCQLPSEALDNTLRPGDPISITYLLKSVVNIRRSDRTV